MYILIQGPLSGFWRGGHEKLPDRLSETTLQTWLFSSQALKNVVHLPESQCLHLPSEHVIPTSHGH